MAVGDITYDRAPATIGNMYILTGTIECDDNATTTAVVSTKSRIISFGVVGNDDDDDVVHPQISLNASDHSGTGVNGSVHITASAGAPDSLRYVCYYI